MRLLETSFLLTTTAIVVILALHCVDATVVSTCKAAAYSDKRVNYTFCMFELSKHHDSPGADIWGLAKVAALVGAADAASAVADIKVLLGKKDTNLKTKASLRQCLKLYDNVKFVFVEAFDKINKRNYMLGKEEVALATPLVKNCDDAFNKAVIRSPLRQHSRYTLQIATICTAITNLIK